MSTTKSEVASLVSLITASAGIIESCYENSSKPYVPSLDDLEPHPLDDELSSVELGTATQVLEGACAQLCALLVRPNHNILNKMLNIYLNASLGIVLNAKVVDIIGTGPKGMPIQHISEKCGIEAKKLGRVLRLLCSHHIFTEVSADVFANNRLSMVLHTSNPLSSTGLHLTDEAQKASGYMYETLSDPEWGISHELHHSAFCKQSGYTGPLFEYYEGKGDEKGAERGARFGRGMMGFNNTFQARAVMQEFPWNELPDGTIINDMGGGVGHISIQLAKTYPNLKLKLQDTPERIKQAKNEIWPQECPEAIRENRVEFKAFDLLKESPIADCDVYYFKHVLHDFSDPDVINILTRTRKAMGPKSRILIHEHILQLATRVPEPKSAVAQAPEPLLANYGVGRARQYNLDMQLLCMANCRVRLLEEYIAIGKEAGLEFYMLWPCGEMGVVELRVIER